MPRNWLHQWCDFIAFGRSYWKTHKYKDRWAQKLGIRHRERNHELYKKAKKYKNLGMNFESLLNCCFEEAKEQTEIIAKQYNLSSDKKEEIQAYYLHDCVDLFWDEFDRKERLAIVSAIREFIINPSRKPSLYINKFEKLEDFVNQKDFSKFKEYVTKRSPEELV